MDRSKKPSVHRRAEDNHATMERKRPHPSSTAVPNVARKATRRPDGALGERNGSRIGEIDAPAPTPRSGRAAGSAVPRRGPRCGHREPEHSNSKRRNLDHMSLLGPIELDANPVGRIQPCIHPEQPTAAARDPCLLAISGHLRHCNNLSAIGVTSDIGQIRLGDGLSVNDPQDTFR